MASPGSPYYDVAGRVAEMIYERRGKRISPDLIYAQLRLESGDFSSELAIENNNFAGITTTQNTGLPLPASENSPGVFYKPFESIDDFVESYAGTLGAYLADADTDDIDLDTMIAVLHPPTGYQYFTDDPDRYKTNMISKLEAADPILGVYEKPAGPWGTDGNYVIPDDSNFGADASFSDRFFNAFDDNGIVAGIRTVWKNLEAMESLKDLPLFNDYSPSEEDIKMVQDALPGNISAQTYILNNATSQKALVSLTQMKLDDLKRESEVDRSPYGLASLGTIAGSILDPVTLATIAMTGGTGLGAKAISQIGKVAAARAAITMGGQLYSKNAATRYAVGALTGALGQAGSRFLAERWGGFEPNYATAVTMGGVLGGLSAKLSYNAPLGSTGSDELIRASKKAEDNALRATEGYPAIQNQPNRIITYLERKVNAEEANSAINKDLSLPPKQDVNAADVLKEVLFQKNLKGASYTDILNKISKRRKVDTSPLWNSVRENEKSLSNTLTDRQKSEEALKYLMRNRSEEFKKTQEGKKLYRSNKNQWKKISQTLEGKNFVSDKSALPKQAQELLNNGRLAFLSEKDARAVLQEYGIKVKPNAKAFTVPGTGLSVILKDRVNSSNLRGVIAHEIGVHGGLRNIMSKDAYDKVMQTVEQKMQNSKSPEWINATRMADNTEEALAYWIEQVVNNKAKKSIFGSIRKGLTGSLKDSTDEELEDLIKRSVDMQAGGGTKVIPLKDGYSVNGVHYSDNNMFSTAFDEYGLNLREEGLSYSEDKIGNTIFDSISDKHMASNARQDKLIFAPFGLKVPKAVGRWLESGWLFGNPYGTLVNSKNPYLNKLGRILHPDPRMVDDNTTEMSIEELKQTILDKFKIDYNKFIDIRQAYINKTTPIYGRGNNRIREVNKQVVDCFNAMRSNKLSKVAPEDYPAEIQQMANQLKVLRDRIVDYAKKDSHSFGMGLDEKAGKGLIDPDWKLDADDFYRIIDDDKYTNFISRFFNNKDDMLKFFKDYAKTFVNKEEMKNRYDKVIEKARKEYEKSHPKVEGKENISFLFISFDAYLDKECRNWAYGIFDKGRSNLNYNGVSKNAIGYWHHKNSLAQFQHRLPMDTSGEMYIPGTKIKFSYDGDLRDYDIDMYLPQIMKRSAGEIAFNAKLRGETIDSVLDKARQELEKERGLVGDFRYNREKEALSMSVSSLLNTGRYNLYKERRGDALSNLIRTTAYANVGGNMTFAQLGEIGSMMAYGGFKTAFSVLPVLPKLLREARMGKEGTKIIEDVNSKLFAEDIATKAWSVTSSTESRVFRATSGLRSEVDAKPSVGGKILDSVASAAKRAALITSTINRLPHLTDAMVNDMRKSIIEDSLNWAMGKNFSVIRNPFSKKKLAAIGIKDSVTENGIKADIKKYLIDKNGDVDAWATEAPDTFYSWKRIVDYQSHRGIQQLSVGNMNILKEKHPIIFQFKDFTMRAVNGQTLRALSSREADDALAALYSMGTNCATYIGLTEARAYAMYPDDRAKRDKFIDKQLTPQRLALAAFTRGALTGPIISMGMDGYEAFTGTPMFRTTVDNTYRDNRTNWTTKSANYNITRTIGNAVRQLPAINSVANTGIGAIGAYNIANGKGTTNDWDAMIRSLPLGQWVGMTYFSSYTKEDLNLRKGK